MKKAKDQEEKQDAISSKTILNSFLKNKKEDHYNFEDAISYKVSTGSLNFDLLTGGVLRPGVYRFRSEDHTSQLDL